MVLKCIIYKQYIRSPGAYMFDGPCNKRVSWPMKFGSPDWSQVPMLERRALRTEVKTKKIGVVFKLYWNTILTVNVGNYNVVIISCQTFLTNLVCFIAQLPCDKEFQKRRNRVAYLSLYYS